MCMTSSRSLTSAAPLQRDEAQKTPSGLTGPAPQLPTPTDRPPGPAGTFHAQPDTSLRAEEQRRPGVGEFGEGWGVGGAVLKSGKS